jgi:hypothetical protein
MQMEEAVTTALLLAALVVGVLIGRWYRSTTAVRSLAARVTGLEREVERLSSGVTQLDIEVARIDASAVLWQSAPVSPDVGPEIA